MFTNEWYWLVMLLGIIVVAFVYNTNRSHTYRDVSKYRQNCFFLCSAFDAIVQQLVDVPKYGIFAIGFQEKRALITFGSAFQMLCTEIGTNMLHILKLYDCLQSLFNQFKHTRWHHNVCFVLCKTWTKPKSIIFCGVFANSKPISQANTHSQLVRSRFVLLTFRL